MAHHEPLKALGPCEWSDIPQDDFKTFLNQTFSHAQAVIDSIPPTQSATKASSATRRARAQTDSAVDAPDIAIPAPLRHDQASLQHIEQLRKEWKEVKVNAKENPHNMTVYKLGSKDGNGAWFARQSVHEGLSFDKWKAGLELEFKESMKVQGSPGSGNIRGIGADKRVEDRDIDGAGHLEVFQLSAQFPGPTSPRDFITLFLTSDFSHTQPAGPKALREFMIVSKPCIHPECPPRDGIIRGRYESVEIIRELPGDAPPPPRRSMTSTSLRTEQGHGHPPSSVELDRPTKIEWLMVTRSDPGGSVPRFMIERGTPPGIVGDAGKFLTWVNSRSAHPQSVPGTPDEPGSAISTGLPHDQPLSPVRSAPGLVTVTDSDDRSRSDLILAPIEGDDLPPTNSSGLYGMIAGALGLAGSVAGEIRRQFTAVPSDVSDVSSDTAPVRDEDSRSVRSTASSENSFASALERYLTEENESELNNGEGSIRSGNSGDVKFASNEPHEKELKRLNQRRRKLDEKVAQMQERMSQRRAGDGERDAAQLAKARDKHEKEIAKQEAKYRRELQKLEEKRAQEVRKAEERRRKQEEREKKNNLTVELEKTRTERDIARKQIEILEHQVGELQAQNTMLVAKMGKMGGGSNITLGTGRERSDSASTKSTVKGSDKAPPATAS